MLITPDARPPTTVEGLLGPEVLARFDRLDVISRRVFAGRLPGERRSKRRGQSVEFDDYREYAPGDDLRHVDWHVVARLDRVLLKLFLEDEDLAFHVVVDASASMRVGAAPNGTPSKLLFAHRLAMALGSIALANQNRVSASVFGLPGARALRTMPPARGRRNVERLGRFLLESLATDARRAIGDRSATDAFSRAMHEVARSRVGAGVLVVITDLLETGPFERALNDVAGMGFDAYLVQTLAPSELEPERAAAAGLAGDLRLTDAETGRVTEVTITPGLIRRYKAKLEAHLRRVERACMVRGIRHSLVRSDADLVALVLNTLRRRGLLG